MVDVKSAVRAAHEYLQGMQELLDNPLDNLRLEEVELSEDERYWLITLGYDLKGSNKLPLPSLLPAQTQALLREYKLFRINSDSGKVEAMKIRKV